MMMMMKKSKSGRKKEGVLQFLPMIPSNPLAIAGQYIIDFFSITANVQRVLTGTLLYDTVR